MKLFTLFKTILLDIYQKNTLANLEEIKKRHGLLILQYIHERGIEQTVLDHELKPYISRYQMSETFYGYILWIAGELMNNVFDHAQTYGKTLKGAVLALAFDSKTAELAIGDLGIGIKASLEKNEKLAPLLASGIASTVVALQDNTSGWPYKRGNGLPDVIRIVEANGGVFGIYSDGQLLTKRKGRDDIEKVDELLPGVIAYVELAIKDFTVPRRSRPQGKAIKLIEYGVQLSSRTYGQEAYEMLVREMVELPKDGALIIDLTGVVMMNSSFGDQAFGVLLENIKEGHFGAKKVYFTGAINEVVDLCLDRIAEIRHVEVVKI